MHLIAIGVLLQAIASASPTLSDSTPAAAVEMLRGATHDGLPLNYLGAWDAAGCGSTSPAVTCDSVLVAALARFGSDLSRGTRNGEHEWHFTLEPEADLVPAALADLAATGDTARFLAALRPPHEQYTLLRTALAEARAAGNTQLVQRLAANMDRWRRVPRKLGVDRIVINIPAWELSLVLDDVERMRLRIVAGDLNHPTPSINSLVDRIVLDPVWDVPADIALDELLPNLRADSTWARRLGFTVRRRDQLVPPIDDPGAVDWAAMPDSIFSRYMLRQAPGPANALGRVKFVFANPWSIRLHDTPEQQVFDLEVRAASHGCVRVSHAADLADVLFAHDERSERVPGERGVERTVVLAQPVPIMITYFTIEVAADGSVREYRDVYLRDLPPPRDAQGR